MAMVMPARALGRVVDRLEGAVLGLALQGEVLGDGGGQRRLAVVDVADRADVDVRLGALELFWPQDQSILVMCGRFRGVGDRAMEPTIGLEPMTSSLPRKCSAS